MVVPLPSPATPHGAICRATRGAGPVFCATLRSSSLIWNDQTSLLAPCFAQKQAPARPRTKRQQTLGSGFVQAVQRGQVVVQALQALAQAAALRRAGHCVKVADQFQRGLLGPWNAAPVGIGPERLGFLQQRCQARREVGVVALFDGFDECRLPMPTVIQPATVLFAQRMGPLQDALSLRGVQAAGPMFDAFLHAFGAFANLSRQLRLDEFLLQLPLFFCERLLQAMHLALVEAAEQCAG